MRKSNNKLVCPSVLNVEKEKRIEYINKLIDEGIKWVHYDIMDGSFVPNTAIEIEELKEISKNTKSHIKDAHLMVTNPYWYAEQLKDYVDYLTFHYEAIEDNLEGFEAYINDNYNEMKIGLAIKPNTKIEAIIPFLDKLALVLVMSVEPGAGGQKFIESSLDKVKFLKQYRLKTDGFYEYLIQIDGGINKETGPKAFKAGVNLAVAGTYLVKNPTKNAIEALLK